MSLPQEQDASRMREHATLTPNTMGFTVCNVKATKISHQDNSTQKYQAFKLIVYLCHSTSRSLKCVEITKYTFCGVSLAAAINLPFLRLRPFRPIT